MHLLGPHSVHAPLGLTQQQEGAQGALFYPVGYRRFLDQPQQLADVASMRLCRNRELDLLAYDPGAADVPNRNAHIPYPQPTR